MNFILLKADIEAKTEFSDIDIITEINLRNIEVVQDIQTADISNYLNVTGKVLAIRVSNDDVAVLTVDALNTFNSFDMSNPTVAYILSQRLDYLVSINLLTVEDTAYVQSLGIKNISRANQLGFNVVTQGDINAARSL